MTIYTVDEYCDSIRCRTTERLDRQKWAHVFECKTAAIMFVVYRANQRVDKCKAELRKELGRLRKAQSVAANWGDAANAAVTREREAEAVGTSERG